MIAVVVVLAALLQEERVVLSGLGSEADALLIDALAVEAPGVTWRFEPLFAADLLERLERDDRPDATPPRVVAAVGFPLLLLERARQLAPGEASPPWFDPVVFATVPDDGEQAWLPESPDGLAELGFSRRLFLEEPLPWNATGALFAQLSAGEDDDALATLLERIDGNVGDGWARSPGGALDRMLRAEQPALAVVTRRAAAARQGEVTAVVPRGGVFGVFLSGAAVRAAGDDAVPVLAVLADDALATRLALAADLVPVPRGGAIAGDGGLLDPVAAPDEIELPDWTALPRLALSADRDHLKERMARAPGLVDRFQAEIRGRAERRKSRFDEYFDAIYFTCAALLVVWLLRRRDKGSGSPVPGKNADDGIQ
jgi:hypothetical protein